jgi:hypothetical protein
MKKGHGIGRDLGKSFEKYPHGDSNSGPQAEKLAANRRYTYNGNDL